MGRRRSNGNRVRGATLNSLRASKSIKKLIFFAVFHKERFVKLPPYFLLVLLGFFFLKSLLISFFVIGNSSITLLFLISSEKASLRAFRKLITTMIMINKIKTIIQVGISSSKQLTFYVFCIFRVVL